MRYIKLFEDFSVLEKYKFSKIVIDNIPSDSDSTWNKITWSYDIIVASLKENPPTYKKNQDLVWLMGSMKQVIAGFAFQYVKKYLRPSEKLTYQIFREETQKEEEYDYDMPYYEGESISQAIRSYKKWGSPEYRDEENGPEVKIEKVDEHLKGCYNWIINHLGWPTKAAKDPEESFKRIFEKAKELYHKIRKKEERESKAIDFFDRISAQSSPHLSLEDQKTVRTGHVMTPDLWKFVSGSKTYNLEANMFLDDRLDLYTYPKVPTGGRLAQTMPETLIVNYYKRMKQNVLAMGFDQGTFMNFLDKYIGFENLKRWFKNGRCYRIGYDPDTEKKFEWSPGSNDLDGIMKFARTFSYDAKFPKYLYFGVIEYFDLFGYIEYLLEQLDYGSYNDSEKEVLIKSGQKMESIKADSQEELENAIKYLKK